MDKSRHDSLDNFSSNDLRTINAALEEAKEGVITYLSPGELLSMFVDNHGRYLILAEESAIEYSRVRRDSCLQSEGPPPCPAEYPAKRSQWYIGMTSRFVKDIGKYDRKIQGRILLTISDIIENPTTPKGDTIKPLTADLKGLWRYRIGDFRLVYLPDPKKNVVTLLAFTGRGDIYESLQVA